MASLRPRALLLAGLLLVACDEQGPGPDAHPEIGELSDRFACADLLVVAASPEASEGLFLGIDDGLAKQAHAHGQPLRREYELDDDRVELRWVSGSNVYAGHCRKDSGQPWAIDEVYQAREGLVIVELAPGPEGELALTVDLEGVVLEPLDDDWRSGGHELPPLHLELELER